MKATQIALWVGTFPYRWTFRYYTLKPIQRIAACVKDNQNVARAMVAFKKGKQQELTFVKVASTLSAAATVGALAWPPLSKTIWLAAAFWYFSLLLAIFSLIQAAQQSALIRTLPSSLTIKSPKLDPSTFLPLMLCHVRQRTKPNPQESQQIEADGSVVSDSNEKDPGRILSKVMIYVWQCPSMLMSWSWLTFILALTVVAPLAAREKPHDRDVALFYCVACTVVVTNFGFSSFWSYRVALHISKQQDGGGSKHMMVPMDDESDSASDMDAAPSQSRKTHRSRKHKGARNGSRRSSIS